MRSLIRQYILPAALFLIGIGIFFMFTQPAYSDVQQIQQETAEYDDALQKADELISLRDKLLTTYNSFDPEDIQRLRRMVPEAVDNVRFVIELDSIASQYGMQIGGIELPRSREEESDGTREGNAPYRSVEISFSIDGSYGDLMRFVRDLERNLRIVDVQQVSFDTGDDESQTYDLTVTTYRIADNQ